MSTKASAPPAPPWPLGDYPIFRSGTDATAGGIGADRPVAVVGRVVSLSAPLPSGQRVSRVVRIRDLVEDIEFASAPLYDRDLIDAAQAALRRGANVVAYGAFLDSRDVPDAEPDAGLPSARPRRRPAGRLLFRLDALRCASRPSLFCQRSPGLVAEADQLIDRLRGEGEEAISDYLLKTFFARYGVATGALSQRFQRGLRLTMLQALSGGMVRTGVNDRLSLLSISPPGAGKKILVDLAGFLSPVCDVVQPGLLSPAGLGARVEYRGGWQAVPGVVPRSNHGTLVLEDIHRLDRAHLNSLQSLFMAILEDARVAPAKAAAATYEARVALHFNANPQAVLGGAASDDRGDPLQRLLALNLPYDLASRIDVILPLHSGDDAAEAAIDMLVQEQPHSADDGADAEPAPLLPPAAAQREDELVKMVVARLRERIPRVSLSGVRGPLRLLMKELTLVIRQAAAALSGEALRRFDADGLFRRMSNSVRKLLGATARLKGRDHIKAEDIDEVWGLLQGKLEVILYATGHSERLQALGPRHEVVRRAQQRSDERFARILREFGGQEISADAIAAALGVDRRVVLRELWDRGFGSRAGFYALPSEAAYAAQQAELLRRGEEPLPAAPVEEDEDATGVRPAPEPPHGRDLVPPVPPPLLPFALGLAALATNPAAVSDAQFPVRRLLWEPPPDPFAVSLAADALVTQVEELQPLANREEVVAALADESWEDRGVRVLGLLVKVGWPEVMSSAIAWARRGTLPGRLGALVAELARRESEYQEGQRRQREEQRSRNLGWEAVLGQRA